MAVITRAQKGSPLTHAEMDANFQALKDLISGGVGGAIDWANPISITTTPTTLTAGKHHVIIETTSDRTHTLPAAASCAGKLVSIQISASTTKLITIDGNASETIDGSLTRIMWAKETAILLSNGATWTKVGGKSLPMIAKIQKSVANSSAGTPATGVITVVSNDAVGYESISGMCNVTAGNHSITIKRPGIYTASFGLYIASCAAGNGVEIYVYKNGIAINYLLTVSPPWASPSAMAALTVHYDNLVYGDILQLYGRQYNSNNAYFSNNSNNFVSIVESLSW